ncbi:hypothetical protein D3C75_797380 [compost metagenome]
MRKPRLYRKNISKPPLSMWMAAHDGSPDSIWIRRIYTFSENKPVNAVENPVFTTKASASCRKPAATGGTNAIATQRATLFSSSGSRLICRAA